MRVLPALALFVADDTALNSAKAALALLSGSRAKVHRGEVDCLLMKSGRVSGVMTAKGPMEADEVVVAAGLGCTALLQTLGLTLHLHSTPGIIVRTVPLPRFMKEIVIAPGFHARQDAEGRLQIGGTFDGVTGDRVWQGTANRQFELAARDLRLPRDAGIESFTVGWRILPEDGMPKIGRVADVGGLYVAAMHSGVTNAAAAGRYGAREIVRGARHELLAPFAAI